VCEIRAAERGRHIVESQRSAAYRRIVQLTPRERQIVALIVSGYATKQIAARLGISYKTVENRRRHIHDKLKVDGLAELVAMVVPMLGGCHPNAIAGHQTPCGLAGGDLRPCRLNPPSAQTSACPLCGPAPLSIGMADLDRKAS
jgi:DNA-binding CsgD family transcriptional regulator